MIIEIASSLVMSGLLGYTYFEGSGLTEGSKIQRIANSSGLKVLEKGKTHTIQLLRKRRHHWGMEYVYRIPLGLSFDDFQRKKNLFEDGLNHKRNSLLDLTLDDIKTIDMRGDILQQIKKLLARTEHRKEILMDYDGTLRIRVYREPLPDMIPFNDSTLAGCKGWKIYIGDSREEPIHHDFEKLPHMVVAGTTRYGKSVFLKSLITTLTHTQSKSVTFTLLDLKGGLAFNRFAKLQQVNTVAKDVSECLESLKAIHEELKLRQSEFLAKGFEDVKEARYKPRHFIVIDEAAELASQGETDAVEKKKRIECERIIAEIARIGGGLGYRLIFATQYPTGDTLPRQVKQNCDARLCFRLLTDTASRVVLDESGAEGLPLIKGRAIYRTDRKHIVQTPMIENEFIKEVIRPHYTLKARAEGSKHERTTIEKITAARRDITIIDES